MNTKYLIATLLALAGAGCSTVQDHPNVWPANYDDNDVFCRNEAECDRIPEPQTAPAGKGQQSQDLLQGNDPATHARSSR